MPQCHHCKSRSQGDTHTHKCGAIALAHTFSRELFSALLLIAGVLLNHFGLLGEPWLAPAVFLLAVAPVAISVLRDTWRLWTKFDFMNEFTLMLLASAGAFALQEYPESVAVLLFYCFGEKLEDMISGRVRTKVKDLIDRMPDRAIVAGPDGERIATDPRKVKKGEMILVSPGERLPLDGILNNPEGADFDTSAITGESLPRHISKGEKVDAGIIPIQTEARVTTTALYADSSLSRILRMIDDAAATQSPTESLLRRITRWYTPLVFILALSVILVPWVISMFHGDASFVLSIWLKRSLVFLVCSCPCALVVGVPLSYFLAIGRASSAGILLKGSRYLDLLRRVSIAFFDKTGTLTTGRFHVAELIPEEGVAADSLLAMAASVDASSTHPIAKAICGEAAKRGLKLSEVHDASAISHGIKATIAGKRILLGSRKLMEANGIQVATASAGAATEIFLAEDGKPAGRILLADTVKGDAAQSVAALHRLGAKVEVLSGDQPGAVAQVAAEIGADAYRAALLPGQKQEIILEARHQSARGSVVFTGDGINDAPALAAADVGIAMGTAGTALAMESAGVVIVGDDIGKVADAIRLSRKVRLTVIEVVAFALSVKLAVMVLGAFGIATLWAAVFADTGVTLLTVIWTILSLWLAHPRQKASEEKCVARR